MGLVPCTPSIAYVSCPCPPLPIVVWVQVPGCWGEGGGGREQPPFVLLPGKPPTSTPTRLMSCSFVPHGTANGSVWLPANSHLLLARLLWALYLEVFSYKDVQGQSTGGVCAQHLACHVLGPPAASGAIIHGAAGRMPPQLAAAHRR
jgi:hypothetical protein